MSRVARRPLNQAAVQFADDEFYANHPEMVDANGHRIPLSPSDPAQAGMRSEWMDYYVANGGELEGDETGSTQPGDPKEPCPRKRCAGFSIQIAAESDHFVPGVESLAISYTITGAVDQVQGLALAVACESTPDDRILHKEIPGPYQANGTIDWPGDVSHSDYDGFLTLSKSPYIVKLVMRTNGCPEGESNEERIAVELDHVDIRVDPVSGTLAPPVQALKDDLSANGDDGRILLASPVFKLTSAEMNNRASFLKYRDHMHDGLEVPLLARVWLTGKDGTAKRSVKALHGSKCLWDFKYDDDGEYEAELTGRSVHAEAKTFMTQVSEYSKDACQPKGRNCHKDLGGVRIAGAARTADESRWAALDGAWGASDPAARRWSSYSHYASVGAADADSGTKFKSGRMAGDTHRITAFVDLDGSFDTVDEDTPQNGPAEQKSNTLRICNWRQVDVVKNYKIGASTTELDIPRLDSEYNKAAVSIQLKSGVITQDIQAQWRTHYQSVITAMSANSDFVKYAALTDPGLYPVKFRDFNDYRRERDRDSNVFAWLWNRICAFFGADSIEDYRNECDNNAYDIYSQVVQHFPLVNNGLTFFKFGANGDHNQQSGSYTAGIAPAISGYTGRNKAVLFVFQAGQATDTLIHEVGHLVFLAHASGHFSAGKQPAGHQPHAHDANQVCLMSYSPTKQCLCGLCFLKLAGWDYSKIDENGTITTT